MKKSIQPQFCKWTEEEILLHHPFRNLLMKGPGDPITLEDMQPILELAAIIKEGQELERRNSKDYG